MKAPNIAALLGAIAALLVAVVAFSGISGAQPAGSTINIEGMTGFTWKGPDGSSSDTPAVIAKVKKGDVLVVTASDRNHGFQTIDAKGTIDDKLVLKCGED